jgi:hypothetical protein
MWLFSTRVLEDIMLNSLKILLGGFFLFLLIFGWLIGVVWSEEEGELVKTLVFLPGFLIIIFVAEEFSKIFKVAMYLILAVILISIKIKYTGRL